MVYDGAMGTNIQKHALTLDDYWGKEGCNELLVLSRPDVIRQIHADFFAAGSDVVETDSFGSASIVLAEYELQDRARELNVAAARLARQVAEEYSTPEKPRFVAGSMGPTTKLPSLGHISYDDMAASYREQASALIEGGVDILLVETCQDLLQVRIALAACTDAIKAEVERGDRHDVAGVRDWRGAGGAGGVSARRHRVELRHRAGRNERCGALPVPELNSANQHSTERRVAAE
jgi:5-methyltetrahydrofolate--homocysteine methyltransferase